MSIEIIVLLFLIIVAVVTIPILTRAFGDAASQSPKRPGGSGDEGSGAPEEEQGQ